MKRLLTPASLGLLALLLPASAMSKAAQVVPPAISKSNRAGHAALQGSREQSHPHSRKSAAAISGNAPKFSSPELKLPLDFEANRGQAAGQYAFVARGPAYALGLSSTEIALSLNRPRQTSQLNSLPAVLGGRAGNGMAAMDHDQLHLRLMGASKGSAVSGLDPKPGVSNYFIGNDPSKWQIHVPHYGRVKMQAVYPGIDLVFYGNPQELEYDFKVAPGSDPGAIHLAADGGPVALDGEGNLVLKTAGGKVELKRPISYQQKDGTRRAVESRFELAPDQTIRLALGAYDHSRELIIDPVLSYAAAFGGSFENQALGMDVDAAGNVYLTGNSCAADFPTTAGNFQNLKTDPESSACQDAFALKLDPTASGLIYSDYFGGTGASTGTHVAVDTAGDLFVTGATTSPDFPLTGNIGPLAPQPCPLIESPQDCPDGFVLKLSPDGSTMAFSTLLGGNQATVGYQLKLNPVTGDVDVLGMTDSSNFLPAMTGPQTSYQGGTCYNNACLSGFLLGLDPSSGALRYGTFLGGAGNNFDTGLGFDSLGNIYVAGATQPPLSSSLGNVTKTYPPAGGATAGGMDIVLAQLKLSQSRLSVGYLTLIQGEGDDMPSGLAVDATGNAYFTGSTASLSLPVTVGAYQTSNKGGNYFGCLWTFSFPPVTCGTIFVGKVDPTGSLSFLTYLGGSSTDWGEAIAVDSVGNIWLTGATTSGDFPFTKDAYGLVAGYDFSPLLAEMSNNGQTLSYASPVAGLLGRATDLKIDSSNDVFLTGYAYTAPATPGTYSNNESPLQPLQYPLYVQKWAAGAAPILSVSSNALAFGPTSIGSISPAQTVTLSNTGAGGLELGIQTVTTSATGSGSAFMESDNCGSLLAPNSTCTLTVRLQPFLSPPNCTVANGCAPQQQTATIVIQNNAPSGTQKITLTGTSGVGPLVAIAPRAITFPPQIAGTSSATDLGTPGATQYVQLSNLGDINLVLASATLGGANAADFQLTNSCPSALPPGFESSCQLSIVFSPAASATGNRTATLTFVDNAADSPQSIPITGSVASAAAALYVYPNPISFGYALIAGQNYIAQTTADVTNVSSSTEVLVTGVTIAGPNAADFNLLPNGHNGQLVLNPGVQGAIGFYFNPTSGPDGPRTATATLITNPAIPGLAPIPLQGVAANSTDPGINIYTNPSPMDLGSVQVGQTSQGVSTYLLIANSGSSCATAPPGCGGPLVLSSIVSGLSDYTVVTQQGSPASCNTFPVSIPVNGECGFNVVFAPTQAGARNTTLTINSNDPGGPVVIPVTGVGLGLPLGDLSATALNFGNAAIGVASPALTVNLQNTASVPLAISGVTSSANYEVASNTCSTTVAPGASCTIGVTFTPPTAGAFSGTLTVSDNDALAAQQLVALTGIGATGPSLMILPSTINFPNQVNNTVGPPQALTLTNFGDTAIAFPANAFVASSSDVNVATPQFVVSSNTCGTSLAVHASCVVNLEFAPTAPTPFPPLPTTEPGTLSLTDSAPSNPQRIYLAGTVVQGGSNQTMTTVTSSLNPAASGQSITFTAAVAGTTTKMPIPTGSVKFLDGATMLGTAMLNGSAQATFATSSPSAGPHSITAVYGSDASYATSTSSVLTEVVNGPTIVGTTISLIGSPNPETFGQTETLTATVAEVAGSGVPTGTVTFYDGTTSLGMGTLTSGIATYSTHILAVGPHSITAGYGGDAGNSSSASSAITVTVTAAATAATTTTLTSSSTTAVVGTAIMFTAAVKETSGSATPTGTVTFYDGQTSLGTGTLSSGSTTYSASLALGTHTITASYGGDASNSSSASSAITVTVTVVAAPDFTLAVSGANAQSVTPGQSASYSFSVAPLNGSYPGTITFSASGLPAGATSIFSPSSITSNSGAQTVALTIQTSAASGMERAPAPFGGSRLRSITWAVLLLPLFGVTRIRRQKGKLVRILFLVSVILGGALVTATLNGCGSRKGNSAPADTTYSVTITATSGTLQHSAVVTLTVE